MSTGTGIDQAARPCEVHRWHGLGKDVGLRAARGLHLVYPEFDDPGLRRVGGWPDDSGGYFAVDDFGTLQFVPSGEEAS